MSSVKNLPFNAGNASLIPDWETKILHAMFNQACMPQVQKPLGCNKEPVGLQKRSNAIIQNKLNIYIYMWKNISEGGK